MVVCGVCRAKHQKLKTGNDQSPGDKKPETEADQRMNAATQKYDTVCCGSLLVSAFLFSGLCVASLLTNLFPVVPNGPAESDSEPANQMSWKEGRQLLRK